MLLMIVKKCNFVKRQNRPRVSQTVHSDETHRYGIIEPSTQEGRRYLVENLIEKPAPGNAPSNLAIMGRYILTPEIFMFLEEMETGAGGEVQLTDAIQKLNSIQRVFAYEFKGKRHDIGEKLGFVKTTIEFALQNEKIRPDILKYLDEILHREC